MLEGSQSTLAVPEILNLFPCPCLCSTKTQSKFQQILLVFHFLPSPVYTPLKDVRPPKGCFHSHIFACFLTNTVYRGTRLTALMVKSSYDV